MIRDWQPGDGMRCKFASRAAEGFPCGKPVKTRVTETFKTGHGPITITSALCANHSTEGFSPSRERAEAQRKAIQKLVNEHYDEYLALYNAEVASVGAEAQR